MNLLMELLFTFAKIGLFTFGGGYAMISIIEDECVEKKKWITHDELTYITVIAESTPGPVAINCATFVGYKKKGTMGAIFATIGMVIPSFVIIYIISLFLDDFLEITWVANAFKGIKVAVGILIFDVAIKMIRKMPKKVVPYIIMILSTVAMLAINVFSINFSSIYMILIAGLIGFLTSFVSKEKANEGGRK